MARLFVTFLMLLFVLGFCMPSFEARRLLSVGNNGNGGSSPGEHDDQDAILPREINVEKHLIMTSTTLHDDQLHSVKADRDRILEQSVPSPGVGHNYSVKADHDRILAQSVPSPGVGHNYSVKADRDRILAQSVPSPGVGHNYSVKAVRDRILEQSVPSPGVGHNYSVKAVHDRILAQSVPSPGVGHNHLHF